MQNPFTPAFGGLPKVFFGRSSEIAFARQALEDPGFVHKAFFLTGSRGSGKTTLLERISQLASEQKWMTIDVHSSHAVAAIIEQLAGGTQKTVERDVRPSALGLSVGGMSSSITSDYSEASLAALLIDTCKSLTLHKGILITIDEIQKVPESDAEDICASVQLALRKGLPVVLALAGLPGSKETVASYPGCTFMQRTYDMQIGSLEVDETIEAFAAAFRMVPELKVNQDALWSMGLFSQGYPYLMQLIGYYTVERAQEAFVGGALDVTSADVDVAAPIALEAYRANVLEPILSNLPESLSGYLRAMCEVVGDDGSVRTGDVANYVGKSPQELSSYRQRLIAKRIIEPDGYGCARFLLPHVADYYTDWRESRSRNPNNQWNRQQP